MFSDEYEKDGGPAFPKVRDEIRNGSSGMSIRDWFAGQALSQACEATRVMLGRLDGQSAAERAYKVADAMLAARVKEPSA